MSDAVSRAFCVPDYEADDGASGNHSFPERIEVKAPRGTRAAVSNLARRKHSKPAEIIRQFVLRGLAQEGVSL